MAQCKGSPQDFIQDAFSPMVAVLCSHDAELLCQKNNLSFVELVQPFCKINSETHIRDPGNAPHTIHNLRVNLRDFNLTPMQPTLMKKMLNETVSGALPPNYENPRNSVLSVGAYDLQLSSSTPWYEAFRECFLQVCHPSDHEFLKHYMACIFVVSSSHADPMDQFSKLTQQQHLQQHQQPTRLPRWFCPNILRYYVLLHDVTAEQGAKGETVYQSMKSTYGINNCHLLHINSRSPDSSDKLTLELGSMPDPWSQFLPKKQDSNETSFESLVSTDTGIFPTHVQEGQTIPSSLSQSQSMVSLDGVESAFEVTEQAEEPENNVQQSSLVINHPLSTEVNHTGNGMTDSPDNMMIRDSQNNPIPDVTHSLGHKGVAHGGCLTLSDHDRLRIFVNEFIVRGLIPWAERMLRTLNEQVTSRKGIHRSFMNISKKWFVGKQPSGQSIASEKTNVVYTPEAPEMQMRRLADLAFMFQLYEMSYQTYHSAKKDFNSEHAWLHFAGALEMACMSVFMLGNNGQRQYPNHYMETAITTYLNSCKSSQFATRCTLLSTEALKSKNMYTEAALQFIKMTSEDSDLRSALLLEQAAHCFIKMKQPMVRKYAFHMILAGHRFSKAGQRRHALRSYTQALQVYKGKHWMLAEDHINFTIGRQSFNLKHLENSSVSFKHLLCAESKQSPPQQNAFLREYLFVFKQQLNQYSPDGLSGGMTSKELPQLPLPVVISNATKVLCGDLTKGQEGQRISAKSTDFKSDEADNPTWQKLEDLIQVSIHGNLPAGSKPTVTCYTNKTNNVHNPICVLGETITVEVLLDNPMKVPLVLTELTLLWSFLPVKGDERDNSPILQGNEQSLASNEKWLEGEGCVRGQVLPELTLQGGESTPVCLSLVPFTTGELHITGLAYKLGTNYQGEPAGTQTQSGMSKPSFIAAITISGKVTLDVQGPRLNSTKEEKTSKTYGPDRRLDLVIVPETSKLEVSFSEFPEVLLCGEVRQVVVYLKNSGIFPINRLSVACTHPDFFTTGAVSDQTCAISDKSGVYETLTNTSDSDSDEHVVESPKVDFVVSLDLPGGRLEPGKELSIPLWLRGPSSPGTHSVHFLFHYQSPESCPKLQHRVVQHKAKLKVHQSLALRATANRADDIRTLTKNSTSSQDLVISLEIENMNNIQDSSITEFSILQVSCVSCQWHLCHLSTQRHSDIRISSGESSFLCLRAVRCPNSIGVNSKRKVFTNVTFDQHQIHSAGTPCSQFFFKSQNTRTFADVEVEQAKQKQHAIEVVLKVEPFEVLDKATELDLTLIVLWKAFVVEESGPCSVITGHHYIRINELGTAVCAPPVTKMAVEQPPVKIVKEPEEDGPPVPRPLVTAQLVKYTLEHDRKISHNFSRSQIRRAKVNVRLHNCSKTTLEVLVSTDGERKETDEATEVLPNLPLSSSFHTTSCPSFFWGGRGTTAHVVKPDCAMSVELLACFTEGGVYDLGRLGISARPLEKISGVTLDWTEQKAQSSNVIVVENVEDLKDSIDCHEDGVS